MRPTFANSSFMMGSSAELHGVWMHPQAVDPSMRDSHYCKLSFSIRFSAVLTGCFLDRIFSYVLSFHVSFYIFTGESRWWLKTLRSVNLGSDSRAGQMQRFITAAMFLRS